ncbi:MAG: alanine:cation symporter family protein [Butyricicoccus sp.]
MSQCNSIAQGLSGAFGIPSGIVGAVTAVLLGAVLLGGLKRLSRVTETLVPFMALFYMGGAVVVLWVHEQICRRRSRRFAQWRSIQGQARAACSATA